MKIATIIGVIPRLATRLVYPQDSRGRESVTLSLVMFTVATANVALLWDVIGNSHEPNLVGFATAIGAVIGIWTFREEREKGRAKASVENP